MTNSEIKKQLATTAPLLGAVVANLQARITEQPAYLSWEYPAEFGGGSIAFTAGYNLVTFIKPSYIDSF